MGEAVQEAVQPKEGAPPEEGQIPVPRYLGLQTQMTPTTPTRFSVPDVGHLYRVMRQIGAPLSTYERHGGDQGGAHDQGDGDEVREGPTPKFPAKTVTGAAPSDDETRLQLEQFARATRKLFDETIIREAMITASCTPAVTEYLASVPSLLWDLKENVLGDKQKRHLERAAGGSGFQGGWQTRYTDLDIFFCDLALCSLKQPYLERVFDETKAMRQNDKESASDFFARLDARRDAVNFLAGKVAQCVRMSDQSMFTTFRAGLRYAGKVMRRLHQERLDISKPEEWEQRAREQNFPGTHVTLLKLREIADNVETDMESKAADGQAGCRTGI
ncbi:hypothetical protein CYMTET_16934 [Cymbomonas tetramitiformis]|uniref:Uncharacterized protein n=1 Tax=Cymbomonas tetramitiformis TaxID=36881 RepID=A0AAE0GBJ0_9CHLO|nr:hypothetical protein CYMTET_16934 [Cymbomonas tetramitiformis]